MQDVPDDLMPNQRGFTNEQLAIRILAEQVSKFCWQEVGPSANTQCLKRMADVFALTEGENGRTDGSTNRPNGT